MSAGAAPDPCGSTAAHALAGVRATAWSAAVGVARRRGPQAYERWSGRAERRAPHCGLVPPRRTAGARRRLHLDDNLERTLFLTGTYDDDLNQLLTRELSPGDVVVDVGANIGVMAFTASEAVGPNGIVHCIEAAPEVARELRRAHRGRANIRVHETAFGASTGTAVLHAADNGTGDRGVRSLFGAGGPVTEVPVTTFDAWATDSRLERLDLVKIDVEGAEYDVLAGMVCTLARLRPRALVVEVIDDYLRRAGASEAALVALLSDAGYADGDGGSGANRLFRPVP